MRMSDWSSDVCSSDLLHSTPRNSLTTRRSCSTRMRSPGGGSMASKPFASRKPCRSCVGRAAIPASSAPNAPCSPARSEEHTSELQSLMRISYAVFCLEKKRPTKDRRHQPTQQDNHKRTCQVAQPNKRTNIAHYPHSTGHAHETHTH